MVEADNANENKNNEWKCKRGWNSTVTFFKTAMGEREREKGKKKETRGQ